MEPEAPTEQAVALFLRESLGLSCLQLRPLHGGRNSRVFLAPCAGDVRVVVKAYHRSVNDFRDRLGTEWNAFSFLIEQGIAWVPKPLACAPSQQLAAYEHIVGTNPQPAALDSSDIRQAVAVLKKLFQLGRSAVLQDDRFRPASEACFSIQSIFENLEDRLLTLRAHAGRAPELALFLEEDLLPFYQAAVESCKTDACAKGISTWDPLLKEARTLSPSDFGFHNALRRPGGELVFLDFEYFGWDDPAKTVSDFLLHPAMPMAPALRNQFLAEALTAFAGVPGLEDRLRLVFPLFGIKWCCILLNEFTKEHAERRVFADGAHSVESPLEQKKVVQLSKSRAMLASLRNASLPLP
jgi:hypothetical protein